MQKQIKNQIAALKLQACSTPADNCKEQIAALKIFYGVKSLKQLYHCLENELTNGMFAALKKASVILVLLLCSYSGIAQDKKRATLELDTIANKMYLVTPDKVQYEIFRDAVNDTVYNKQNMTVSIRTKQSKYYIYLTKDGEKYKWYGVFRTTPKEITFDRKY